MTMGARLTYSRGLEVPLLRARFHSSSLILATFRVFIGWATNYGTSLKKVLLLGILK